MSNLELIELFLKPSSYNNNYVGVSNTANEEFSTAFSKFLDNNTVLKAVAPESTFFIWFFLGALGNLPGTGLMTKMGFSDLYLKCNIDVIRIAYHVKSPLNNKIELVLRSILLPSYHKSSRTDPGSFTKEELKELVSIWDLDSANDITIDATYLQILDVQTPSTKYTMPIFVQAKDETNKNQELLFMVIQEKVSNQVQNVPFNAQNDSFITFTENNMNEISTIKMSIATLLRPDIDQVDKQVLKLMTTFYDQLHENRNSFQLPADPQAFISYVAGIFVLNYQVQYHLLCSIQHFPLDKSLIFSIMPLKKYTRMLQANIPIIITSAFGEVPNEKLDQLIQHGTREMLPSFATDSKFAVLVVTNYDLPPERFPIQTRKVEINQGLLVKFFTIYQHLIDNTNIATEFIEREFNALSESIGDIKSDNVAAFIFGQLLSIKGENKFVFKHNQDMELYANMKTFGIQHGEKLITFNIGSDEDSNPVVEEFLLKGRHNFINVHLSPIKYVTNVNILPQWKEIVVDQFTTEVAMHLHTGEKKLISEIDPQTFYYAISQQRDDVVKSVLTNCIFSYINLIQNTKEMELVIRGIFASTFRISTTDLGLIMITALSPEGTEDMPLMDDDADYFPPMFQDDNEILQNKKNVVLIKLHGIDGLHENGKNSKRILDSPVVPFWTDYAKLDFQEEKDLLTMCSIVSDFQAYEMEAFIESTTWTLDENWAVSQSCQHKRAEGRCSLPTTVNISSFVTFKKERNSYGKENLFGQDKLQVPTNNQNQENNNILSIDGDKLLNLLSMESKQVAKEVLNYLMDKKAEESLVTGNDKMKVVSLLEKSKHQKKLEMMSNLGMKSEIETFLAASPVTGSMVEKQLVNFRLLGLRCASSTLKSMAPFAEKVSPAYIMYDFLNKIDPLNANQFNSGTTNSLADTSFQVINFRDIFVDDVAEGSIVGHSGILIFIGPNAKSLMANISQVKTSMSPEGPKIERCFKKIIEQSEGLTQLAKHTSELLNSIPEYRRYFSPIKHKNKEGQWIVELDNCVDLTKETSRPHLAIDAAPLVPVGNELLCFDLQDGTSSQDELEISQSRQILCKYKYHCENMMGIENLRSMSNTTLIDLGDGNDCATGSHKTPNVFLIGNGAKNIFGGFHDDTFILNGNLTLGNIFGKGGTNLLDLSQFALNNSKLIINLSGVRNYIIFENREFLYLNKINKIIGRESLSDKIYPGCDMEYIDSGTNNGKDIIYIQNKICHYNLTIRVRNMVNIINNAVYGEFTYLVETNQNQSLIHIAQKSKADHRFIFDEPFDSLKLLQSKKSKKGPQIVLTFPGHTVTICCEQSNCSYYFADNVFLRIEHKNKTVYFHGYVNSSLTPMEAISTYSRIAKRLGMSFMVTCEQERAIVFVSQTMRKQGPLSSVVQNDPTQETYIYGSCEENLFIITAGNKKLNTIRDAVIRPIFIYEEPQCKDTIRTLVLTKLYQQLKTDLNSTLIVKVIQNEMHLELELLAEDKTGRQFCFTHIQFNGSVEYNLYENLQIIINDVPHRAAYHKMMSNFEIDLRPMPYISLGRSTQFLILYPGNIPYPFTEIHIDRSIRQLDFYYIKYDSLILLEQEDDDSIMQEERFYIILIDFFYTVNLQTMKFSFANRQIDLVVMQQELNSKLLFESYVSACNHHYEEVMDRILNSDDAGELL